MECGVGIDPGLSRLDLALLVFEDLRQAVDFIRIGPLRGNSGDWRLQQVPDLEYIF